jgi:hypothetical protein
MRYLILVGVCVLFFQCKKESVNIDYTSFGDGIVVTSLLKNCPGCSAQTGYGLDLNKDGMRDFTIIISHSMADSIYTMKNAYYIFIRTDEVNLSAPNNFSLRIATDKNKTTNWPDYQILADLKNYGEEPSFNDSIHYQNAWIYKVDDYDSLTVEGNHYIGLKLIGKNGKHYYGWVQLGIEFWKVTIKDFAFCSTPNHPIQCGKLD